MGPVIAKSNPWEVSSELVLQALIEMRIDGWKSGSARSIEVASNCLSNVLLSGTLLRPHANTILELYGLSI